MRVPCAQRTDVKIIEITNVDFSLRHFLLPLMRAHPGARPRGGRHLRRGAAARRGARRGLPRSCRCRSRAGCRRWRMRGIFGPCAPVAHRAARPRARAHADQRLPGPAGGADRRGAARRLHVPRLPVQPARLAGCAAPARRHGMDRRPAHRRLHDRLDERGGGRAAAAHLPRRRCRRQRPRSGACSGPTRRRAPASAPRWARRRIAW